MEVQGLPRQRGVPELDALRELGIALGYVVVAAIQIDLFLHEEGTQGVRQEQLQLHDGEVVRIVLRIGRSRTSYSTSTLTSARLGGASRVSTARSGITVSGCRRRDGMKPCRWRVMGKMCFGDMAPGCLAGARGDHVGGLIDPLHFSHMAEKAHSDDRIRFGVFAADLQSKELFKAGQRIPLANQSFVALATLLERPGQLVSREELRQRLWPDNRVVEFDQGLNAIINRLREALGSGPGGAASLIETLPRRGYRFIGSIEGNQPPAVEIEMPRKRSGTLAIALCGLAVLIVLIAAAAWLRRGGGASQPGDLKVIPLTSLAGREVAPQLMAGGDQLLFGWNGAGDAGGGFDLYSRGIDSERLVRITHHPATALYGAWAPGGGSIALARQTDATLGSF